LARVRIVSNNVERRGNMEKIKANITSIMGTIMLVLSALNLIISKLDYVYRPKSYVLFLVVYVILAVAITFFSIRYKGESNKVSKLFASFQPLIASIYVITLLFSFDFKRIKIVWNFRERLVENVICEEKETSA